MKVEKNQRQINFESDLKSIDRIAPEMVDDMRRIADGMRRYADEPVTISIEPGDKWFDKIVLFNSNVNLFDKFQSILMNFRIIQDKYPNSVFPGTGPYQFECFGEFNGK